MLIGYTSASAITLNFFHRVWSDNRLFQLVYAHLIFYIIYTSDEDWIFCVVDFFTSPDQRKPAYLLLYLDWDISCYFWLRIYKIRCKFSICCEENYTFSLRL